MENNDLTLTDNDIQSAIEIIDVAISRGAVRGEEAQYVGTVRNKLHTFLEAVKRGREEASAQEYDTDPDLLQEESEEVVNEVPAPTRSKRTKG